MQMRPIQTNGRPKGREICISLSLSLLAAPFHSAVEFEEANSTKGRRRPPTKRETDRADLFGWPSPALVVPAGTEVDSQQEGEANESAGDREKAIKRRRRRGGIVLRPPFSSDHFHCFRPKLLRRDFGTLSVHYCTGLGAGLGNGALAQCNGRMQ